MAKILVPDINTLDYGAKLDTRRHYTLLYLNKYLRELFFALLSDLSQSSYEVDKKYKAKKNNAGDTEEIIDDETWEYFNQVIYLASEPDSRNIKDLIKAYSDTNRLQYPFATISSNGEVDDSGFENKLARPQVNSNPVPYEIGGEKVNIQSRYVKLGYNLKIYFKHYSNAERIFNNLVLFMSKGVKLDFEYDVGLSDELNLFTNKGSITSDSFPSFEQRTGTDMSTQSGKEVIIDVPFYVMTSLLTRRDYPNIQEIHLNGLSDRAKTAIENNNDLAIEDTNKGFNGIGTDHVIVPKK